MLHHLVNYFFLFILFGTGWSAFNNYNEHILNLESIQSQKPLLEKQINEKEKDKQLVADYYKDIEAAKEKIENVAKEVEKLQQQLPDAILDTQNLELFSSVAQSLNVKNVFLTPKDEMMNDFFVSKEYEFKATGTFLQFLIFLERLAVHERLFNIESLKIEHTREKQKGRFQLVNAEIILTSYKYNPNYVEDRGIQRIEQEFANPVEQAPKKKIKVNNAGGEE